MFELRNRGGKWFHWVLFLFKWVRQPRGWCSMYFLPAWVFRRPFRSTKIKFTGYRSVSGVWGRQVQFGQFHLLQEMFARLRSVGGGTRCASSIRSQNPSRFFSCDAVIISTHVWFSLSLSFYFIFLQKPVTCARKGGTKMLHWSKYVLRVSPEDTCLATLQRTPGCIFPSAMPAGR